MGMLSLNCQPHRGTRVSVRVLAPAAIPPNARGATIQDRRGRAPFQCRTIRRRGASDPGSFVLRRSASRTTAFSLESPAMNRERARQLCEHESSAILHRRAAATADQSWRAAGRGIVTRMADALPRVVALL